MTACSTGPRKDDGPLEDAERLARERGRQLMSAVLAVDPDAEVVFTRGSNDCAETPPEVDPWANPEFFELQCPFLAGAVDAASTPGQVHDGGQLYRLRTVEEFENAYVWRDQTMLGAPELDFQSSDDTARWTDYVSQSNGVMTKWSQDPTYEMDPATYADTLCHALETDDDLTWAYTTEDDPLRPGFPEEWRQAIDDAVACAATP